MKTLSLSLSLVASAVLCASCYQVPVSGRRALNLVDSKEVAKMSAAEFENMKKSYRLSRNKAQIDQLQRVGDKLASVVPWWDMQGAEWEYIVFDAPNDINAFAMSGGKVGVFSGLYKLVSNDDQLAAVISHEIAHVTSKHVEQRLSGMLAAETLGNVAMVAGGGGLLGAGSYLAAIGIGASSPAFDRGKELEADQVGLIYMAQAGFDPREAIKVLEKLDVLENGAGGSIKMVADFGDTHPTNPARVAKMHEAMPAAMKIYEQKVGPVQKAQVVK